MKRAVLRIVIIGEKQPLLSRPASVFCLHQYLGGLPALVDIIIISLFLYISGVKEMDSIFIGPGASGIDAIPVEGTVGFQENALVFPVDQIAADRVAPAFSPLSQGVLRHILIKCMVCAVILT